MSTAVRDLDVLVDEPLRVKLGGQEYLLPADMPIPTMLRMQALQDTITGSEDDAAAARASQSFYDEILKLFRVHQPDLEDVPLQPVQLWGLIPAVYGGEEDSEEPNPTRRKSGPKSTTAKKTRSRS